MKWKWAVVPVIIPAALVTAMCLAWSPIPHLFRYGLRFGEDAKEARGIVLYVCDHYAFSAKSKIEPDRAPVFCIPGSRGGFSGPQPHRIHVYTVTEQQGQDRILGLIREYRAQNRLRPVIVTFYREENWASRKSDNGGDVMWRGQEEILRTEKLE